MFNLTQKASTAAKFDGTIASADEFVKIVASTGATVNSVKLDTGAKTVTISFTEPDRGTGRPQPVNKTWEANGKYSYIVVVDGVIYQFSNKLEIMFDVEASTDNVAEITAPMTPVQRERARILALVQGSASIADAVAAISA